MKKNMRKIIYAPMAVGQKLQTRDRSSYLLNRKISRWVRFPSSTSNLRRNIDKFEDKLDSRGYILVTKDVLKIILNKLMMIERELVIKDGIEYYVLNNDELDCYTELLL